MIVKITDYGCGEEDCFVDYKVSELSSEQLKFLNENLSEETTIDDDIKMHFEKELYPFQSDVAKIRLDDFIAREEIEMAVFLLSFLEDM